MTNIDLEKYQEKMQIESQVDFWSAELNKFPSYPNGLVPDRIRATEKYKYADSNYKKWFSRLRDFNSNLSKIEKKIFADYSWAMSRKARREIDET